MAGSKKSYFRLRIIIAALASFISVGCSFTDQASSTSKEAEQAKTNGNIKATVVKPADDLTGNSAGDDNDAAQNRKKKGTEKRILFDGSQYVVMRDAYGNKIEYRYFEPKTGVKFISVQTFANGSSTIQVRTWDGFVKQIDSSKISDPWNINPRDVALLTGFPLDYQNAAPATDAAAPSPVVSLPSKSIVSKQLEAPIRSTAQAQEGKPSEQANKSIETPRLDTPDQSALLRRMLGSSL